MFCDSQSFAYWRRSNSWIRSKNKTSLLHLLCPNWLTWLFLLKMTYRGLLDVLAPSKRMIEMEGGFLHLTTSGDKIRLSMKVQSFVLLLFFFENWTLHCRLRRTKEKTGCYKRGVLLLQPAFSFLFLNWLIEQEKYQITNFLVHLSDLVILVGTWLWWRI